MHGTAERKGRQPPIGILFQIRFAVGEAGEAGYRATRAAEARGTRGPGGTPPYLASSSTCSRFFFPKLTCSGASEPGRATTRHGTLITL